MDILEIQQYPNHRECGVGCYTDTQERVRLPLAGLKQSVYHGCRQPKGRHRDLEKRAKAALHPSLQIRWMKAHQTHNAVIQG
eukprot:3939490-Amphidinium_carterae.3